MSLTISMLLLLVIMGPRCLRGEIIKPYKEWLCNYCAMGKLNPIPLSLVTLIQLRVPNNFGKEGAKMCPISGELG